MEKEQKELLIKQESLKGHIGRLTKDLENSQKQSQDIKQALAQQCCDQEANFQQAIFNLKKQNEENVKKLNEEKVYIYI